MPQAVGKTLKAITLRRKLKDVARHEIESEVQEKYKISFCGSVEERQTLPSSLIGAQKFRDRYKKVRQNY